MEDFKFINKKHVKLSDREFYNCNLYNTKLDCVLTIFIEQKVFEKLNYKFGDIVKPDTIKSSTYVNKYGQSVTSYSLV